MASPDRTSAQRAESLYDRTYAQRYRHRDDELTSADTYLALVEWLGSVCRRFDHRIRHALAANVMFAVPGECAHRNLSLNSKPKL